LVSDSDYKDDGTNILLDANENAFGPGLDLDERGQVNGTHDIDGSLDLKGLNRYPDP
jgi:histidinol-phosphate aminotransferase